MGSDRQAMSSVKIRSFLEARTAIQNAPSMIENRRWKMRRQQAARSVEGRKPRDLEAAQRNSHSSPGEKKWLIGYENKNKKNLNGQYGQYVGGNRKW